MGNAVITNGEIKDYPIEPNTKEFWKEYYTSQAEFEDDLTGMSEKEYLETYSKELREALNLDKEFYQQK